MLRKTLTLLFLTVVSTACMSDHFLFIKLPVNKFRNGHRSGLWVTYEESYKTDIQSKGRFRKGLEVGKWTYYNPNGTICKIEKYKDNIANTVTFYPDGTIESWGQTQFDILPKNTHWYYLGKWPFYNQAGLINEIKYYDLGQLIRDDKYDSAGNCLAIHYYNHSDIKSKKQYGTTRTH